MHRIFSLFTTFIKDNLEIEVMVIYQHSNLEGLGQIDINVKKDIHIFVKNTEVVICHYAANRPADAKPIILYGNNINIVERNHRDFMLRRYGNVLEARGVPKNHKEYDQNFLTDHVRFFNQAVNEFINCGNNCHCSYVYTVAYRLLTLGLSDSSEILTANENIDVRTANHQKYLLRDLFKMIDDEWQLNRLL